MEVDQPEGQAYDPPDVRYVVRLVAGQEIDLQADGGQQQAKPDDAGAILQRFLVAERPRRLQKRSR